MMRHKPGYEAARSITALRDITQEEFDRYGMQLPEPMRRRARYVIAENARVLQTVKLLETGSFVGDSQASLVVTRGFTRRVRSEL